MRSKVVNGFTEDSVNRVLKALDTRPIYRIRAELLDLDNVKLLDLVGLQETGEVSYNVEQPIQGGASVEFLETDRHGLHSSHASYLTTFASLITSQSRLFHLRMGETSGNAADFTGNGRTFTATATITYSQAALGNGDTADNAFKFNGSTGRLDIAYAAWMNVSLYTIAGAWKGTGTNQTLIDRDNGSTQRVFRVGVDSSGYLYASFNFTSGAPAYKTFTTTAIINDGSPHLIHVLYDKVYVSIFVDGRRVLRTAETRTVSTPTAQGIRIAADGTGANFSSGTFDEWGMIGRVISARELRDEYQAWSGQTTELLFDKDRGDRLRIYYGVTMPSTGTDGTAFAEWAQITALMSTPRRVYTQTGITLSISCQDQNRLMADDTFTSRHTVAAAANPISGTNGVLSIAQGAGFDTSGWAVTATTETLRAAVDFEIGTSKLDAINQLLAFTNYRPLRFDGSGHGVIEPNKLDVDRSLADTFADDDESIISAEEIPVEIAARSVVNSSVVFDGNPDATPIVVGWDNTLITSPTSIVNQQATVQVVRQIDATSTTTATGQAQQIVNDETARLAQRVTLELLPYPIFEDRDKARLNVSVLDIDGDYVVFDWRLPLDPTQLMAVTFLSVVDVT